MSCILGGQHRARPSRRLVGNAYSRLRRGGLCLLPAAAASFRPSAAAAAFRCCCEAVVGCWLAGWPRLPLSLSVRLWAAFVSFRLVSSSSGVVIHAQTVERAELCERERDQANRKTASPPARQQQQRCYCHCPLPLSFRPTLSVCWYIGTNSDDTGSAGRLAGLCFRRAQPLSDSVLHLIRSLRRRSRCSEK